MAEAKQTIIETTQKLLDMLGITAGITVEKADEGYNVTLETEEGGLLIGYHGETLEALQTIIALSSAKALGEFARISLEIGDYKKNRIDSLKYLAEQAKEKALESKQEVVIPNLKSWERRIIHTLLAEDEKVTSVSTGEGRDRVLAVRPK